MRLISGVLTLCLLSGGLVASVSAQSLFEMRPEHTRDHVPMPRDKSGEVAKLVTPPCAPCWGEETLYTAFYDSNVVFNARRYDGHDIVLFVPRDGADAALMTAERITRLVDRLDLLYRAYRDLLNWAPPRISDPGGKHVFALLPTRPSNFYGLAILGGDRTEYHADVMSETALDSDVLSNVWVHELAHNFDPIESWDFGADPAHEWTSVLQVWYARRQARMDEVNSVTFAQFERNYLNQYFTPYINDPNLSWQDCAAASPRPQVCSAVSAQFIIGSLVATIGQHAEPAVMRDWLRAGDAADESTSVLLDSADDRIRFILGSLAQVSNTRTQCIANEFRIPVLVPDQPEGAMLFEGCRDSDSDGVRRWRDCDDGLATVFPDALELVDGFDNDCDGTVDELIVNETSFGGDFSDVEANPSAVGSVPLEISGNIAVRAEGQPLDVDFVALASASPGQLRASLCNVGATTIELVGQPSVGPAVGPLRVAAPGECSEASLGDNQWLKFWVRRLGSGAGGGDYRLTLTPPAPGAGWPHTRPLTLTADAGGGASATINEAAVPNGLGNVQIRWSALSGGEFKTTAVGTTGALTASFPANLTGHPQRPLLLRASMWRDGMLIEEPSTAVQVTSARVFANGFEN